MSRESDPTIELSNAEASDSLRPGRSVYCPVARSDQPSPERQALALVWRDLGRVRPAVTRRPSDEEPRR